MAQTLTIRLGDEDRAALAAAARERGEGLSSYVRDVAEQEAARLRREAVRAEGQRVVTHLAQDARARRELDELGTPQVDLW